MEFTTQIAQYMRDLAERATDGKLQEVIEECMALTETNCSWVRYNLRDVVHDVVSNEIQLRLDRKGNELLRPVLEDNDG